MQVLLTDFTEKKRNWFIHNDQNGHEYAFTIDLVEETVQMKSSSTHSQVHRGLMAVELLDKLMTSFASSFASLNYMTTLNGALKEGKEILGDDE